MHQNGEKPAIATVMIHGTAVNKTASSRETSLESILFTPLLKAVAAVKRITETIETIIRRSIQSSTL